MVESQEFLTWYREDIKLDAPCCLTVALKKKKIHALSVFSEVLGSNLLSTSQDDPLYLHLGIVFTCSKGISKSKLIIHLVDICTEHLRLKKKQTQQSTKTNNTCAMIDSSFLLHFLCNYIYLYVTIHIYILRCILIKLILGAVEHYSSERVL